MAAIVAAVALSVLAAGCGGSFDPTGACSGDGKVPGAYPELEALVPTAYQGTTAPHRDSGRTCTAEGLGTLATHGVKELRFAGGTWSLGAQSGLTLATFTSVDGPELEPLWLAEFYETTARSGKNVETVDASDVDVFGDGTGRRIDVLNNESYQSVIVWKHDGHVVAALVANFIREIQSKEAHDKVVRTAIEAWTGT